MFLFRTPAVRRCFRVTRNGEQSRRGAVVFLHGSGDTGPGVREWLESASGGKFSQRIAELGLGTTVFPTAPVRRYTLAGGMPSTVWFDREDLSPSSRQDRAGVLQSLQLVRWSRSGRFREGGVDG